MADTAHAKTDLKLEEMEKRHDLHNRGNDMTDDKTYSGLLEEE